MSIDYDTLIHVLEKMLGSTVLRVDYEAEKLHGGTLGDVQLIAGVAETTGDMSGPFKVVLKRQKKWERHGDPNSWRREYDLYKSDLGEYFAESFRWPVCYHATLDGDETEIWMEYVEGVSGQNLTADMYERAAEALGRFQGRLYAQQPSALKSIPNLSCVD